MKTANLLLALEDDVLRHDVVCRLENSERHCSFDEQNPSDWRGLLNRVSQHRPEILLIELSAIKADLANSLRAIKKSAPQTKIVALHSSDDPKTILAAMRAGANEFIHPPFEETFEAAIERVINSNTEEQRPERRGKVVGFLSAKGGCGATTLACHIAADLKLQTGQNVLLADLDLSSGMVGFLMKIESQYSVLDAISNLGRLDESLWKALVSEWKPGVGVIPGPDAFSYDSAPARDELRHLVRFMRTQHDWVVLDLGRSFTEVTAALYQELDDLLLVSVLEVTALHGLKAIAQKLRDRGEDMSKLQLILNRTPKMMDMTHEDLQKILGRPLYAMLPNDYPSLYQAYSTGTLLPANNRLAQQFSVLTTKLAGIEAPKPQRKFSLFR